MGQFADILFVIIKIKYDHACLMCLSFFELGNSELIMST